MERKLYSKQEVIRFISEGKKMVLSASENMLDQLPKGNWIGGTIPYFMDTEKGIQSKEKIFVDDQSDIGTDFNIKKYCADNLNTVASDGFSNGFSIVIIPASTKTHTEFSLNSLNYPDIFNNPIIGFISGTHLNDLNTKTAKIYNGSTKEKFEDGLICLNIKLPENKIARVEIINIFEQNKNSDIITFKEDGFSQKTCVVNGKERNFAEYLKEIGHDIKFPLIVNQNGALINKSFQSIDEKNSEVSFYAPIFKEEEYYFSKNITNYKNEFNLQIPKTIETNYACNCILNYLYGEFEDNKVNITGATTFGEIAFQLLNQTLVFLEIDNI